MSNTEDNAARPTFNSSYHCLDIGGKFAEQLKKIPPDSIENFQEAVVRLDEEQCLRTIGMISDHTHELGERLRRMVKELQYKEILAALDKLTGRKVK